MYFHAEKQEGGENGGITTSIFHQLGLHQFIVKSSHLYLYSAFNNTDCAKAALQYQIEK